MKILFFNNIIGSALNIAMTMSHVSFEKSRSRQLTSSWLWICVLSCMNKLLFYNEKEMYLPCCEWHFFSSILITCNWIYLICQWNRRSVKHLFEYSWILIYHIQLNYSVTTVYRFLTVECKLSWTATGPRSGLGGWVGGILITIPYPSYLFVDPLTAGFQLIINGQD